jgi:hypothetical protein
MKYQIDENTIWDDTGKIAVYNYPPSSKMTFSYVKIVYREFKKNVFGWKEVEGNPIYFHDMKHEHLVLATILGETQNALLYSLPKDKKLKIIKDNTQLNF